MVTLEMAEVKEIQGPERVPHGIDNHHLGRAGMPLVEIDTVEPVAGLVGGHAAAQEQKAECQNSNLRKRSRIHSKGQAYPLIAKVR